MTAESLQERFAPRSVCYGCGPANAQGLHVKSFPDGDDVVADWTPAPHHEAFPGVLNGGVIGTLLDCHMAWTAAWHLVRRDGLASAPSVVTAEYAVKLLRPAPAGGPVHLVALATGSEADRVTVEARLEADGAVCATGRGLFVRVKPGHPAYDRWSRD